MFFTCYIHIVAVEPFKSPALSDTHSSTLILLPDIQNYARFERNQGILELMTAWISENINTLNIKALLCTGDLVEQNNMPIPGWIRENQSSSQQWKSASKAFERLDGKIPYILCTGNHDYGYRSAENRMSYFSEYFPTDRNVCWRESLVSITNNAQGYPTLENAAYELNISKWGKLLIIVLEFAPRNEVLQWAKELAANEKYKKHKCILLTHSYLNHEGKRIAKEGYKIPEPNWGEDIWKKLVFPSSNIRFVISGHITSENSFRENVGFQTDINIAGRNVHQMVFNAQAEGGGKFGNGGDGWLRIIELLPDGRTVKIQTFSPFFAISPSTQEYAWRIENYDNFEFVIE